jgi:SulP family sulfate permease
VDRPLTDQRVLTDQGGRVQIFRLDGYIFFGTGTTLLNRVRERAARRDPPLEYLVLDFRRVSGIDSSAAMSLIKMRTLAEREGFVVVLTGVMDEVAPQLAGLASGTDVFRSFPDLDHGVEWCEGRLLGEEEGAAEPPTLQEMLGADGEDLERWFLREEVEAGVELIRQGSRSEELFYVERGQVTVWLALAGNRRIRLRTMRPGTVVGELGLYLGEARSASVITETDATVLRLTSDALRRMAGEAPELAASFHELMVRMTAERLAHSNQALRALLD